MIELIEVNVIYILRMQNPSRHPSRTFLRSRKFSAPDFKDFGQERKHPADTASLLSPNIQPLKSQKPQPKKTLLTRSQRYEIDHYERKLKRLSGTGQTNVTPLKNSS